MALFPVQGVRRSAHRPPGGVGFCGVRPRRLRSQRPCAGAVAALLALLPVGCAELDGAPREPSAYYNAEPRSVLDAAADLLRRQGYEVGETNVTFLGLQAEKVEVAQRSDGSLSRGTVVSHQVLLDADSEDDRTRLSALFTISERRPTGEQRTWVPESPLSRRLSSRFYADLHRELRDGVEGGARAASAHY
jgi:hypothetical protein